ncbi:MULTISPECIES: NAD(P)/FAD-dependent oxidoreductase [unclassified Fusibacter]|uniref:NAD(P)/FAD-dependent oxidoreductase n=1 Tax=unclassified Fusibacter TaxID=2624464 RepID=UPI00101169E5|nr:MULTISPECIES: FAD-dependent oxidoreductase [unclassified Fusibacter]MCK8059579.1 NAD(P)/FAD-dependent oxidoreductase [Fusibacter sp. A2]NPE21380.1 FAD-dependent oxidoreductase [Fusibacter sp. A1]RXV61796.1 FAD-dependent oxidoreductase [Fusibacter sp. A1]
MIHTDVLIVGGGPAGLAAAITASRYGKDVILMERDPHLGGQLIKQTHMFFGSEKQRASVRGFDIAKEMFDKLDTISNIRIFKKTTVTAMYDDGVVTASNKDGYIKLKPKVVIIATGAYEKSLAFPGNTLPGVYGAGAVQTLMNMQGIKPGQSVVMVGAGNIGLIVSYQLLQAGVDVKAIVDAAPSIGGYAVHAAKVRRMGVPIHTRYTVKKAHGEKVLTGATIWALDERWQPVEGTEIDLECDIMCVSVGLSPLSELLWQRGCEMVHIGELGGYVPRTDLHHETNIPGVFVAGDVGGIEEASSAMVEGYLTGLYVNKRLGVEDPEMTELIEDYHKQLMELRSGPVGDKIRAGLDRAKL